MTTASLPDSGGYTRRDDRRRGPCPPLPGLWQEHVTTLLADVATPEVLRHWAGDCSARMGDPEPGDKSVRRQLPAAEPAVGAATAPGSSRGPPRRDRKS